MWISNAVYGAKKGYDGSFRLRNVYAALEKYSASKPFWVHLQSALSLINERISQPNHRNVVDFDSFV